MVDLVSFEQVAARVASVVLALLELVERFVVQHVSRAHEEPLHALMAQHAGGFSKVVELNASFLDVLAESQELLVVVRHPLDANALVAVGSDEDAPALVVGLPHRQIYDRPMASSCAKKSGPMGSVVQK